ncbi:MAG: hypothetical protein DMG49_27705 [Acidobacteria bacterium]|nr:MAG: hypothetical protein DMG49_27705 [Acidobacteriota bacterium]
MAVPTGRSGKRIAKEVAAELARLDHLQLKETAITQNVSVRGMRAGSDGKPLAPRGPRAVKLSEACLL